MPDDLHGGKALRFNPWLMPREGSPLAELAAEVFAALPPPEITPGRKHRADAERRRMLSVMALIANLASLYLMETGSLHYRGLSVPLKKTKQNRYNANPAGFTAQVLARSVSAMEASGHVSLLKGKKGRAISEIALSESLRVKLAKAGISSADIVIIPGGGETIHLKHKPHGGTGRANARGELIDYRETAQTGAMREEMEAINEMLNAGSVCFDGQPVPPQRLVRVFQVSGDDQKAQPEFNRHGRLYGGFWESLEWSKRHLITIGGEPIADLDYCSLWLQMAYARQGAEMPHGDPYALPGLGCYRGAVKRTVASLFAKEGNLTAMRLPSAAKEELPEGWTMGRFIEAFSEKHNAVMPLLGRGLALEFMFLDSQMMVKILLDLRSQGITALPMHDGLMVGQSAKETAVTVMKNASMSLFGRAFEVAEKPLLSGFQCGSFK